MCLPYTKWKNMSYEDKKAHRFESFKILSEKRNQLYTKFIKNTYITLKMEG